MQMDKMGDWGKSTAGPIGNTVLYDVSKVKISSSAEVGGGGRGRVVFSFSSTEARALDLSCYSRKRKEIQ
jgi:hypothetical protein